MKLSALKPGDLVEISKRGWNFQARITQIKPHQVEFDPIDTRATFKTATAREVVRKIDSDGSENSTKDKMSSAYKIRKISKASEKGDKKYVAASIGIPTEIADNIPDDMRFSCEPTEDGILFRPLTMAPTAPADLPAWLAAKAEKK